MRETAKKSNVLIECINTMNRTISTGSGVVISQDGIILTNYHVIDNATSIKVKMYNGKEFNDAIIIGYGKDIVMAVIKIDTKDAAPANLEAAAELFTIIRVKGIHRYSVPCKI